MELNSRLAVFTTANKNYVKHAIRCFELLEIQNPDKFDFYIITSEDIGKGQFTSQVSISYIKEDLSSVYPIGNDWPYPGECFWVFKAPNLMYDLGYKHSMYVDADVACINPIDLSFLSDDFVIAGSKRMSISHWSPITAYNFISQVEKRMDVINSNFNVIKDGLKSIHSGVLFFNNEKYTKENIFRTSEYLFKKAKAIGAPRKGDDSLLSLIQLTTPAKYYKILSTDYNYYYERPTKESTGDTNRISLMHMISFKPWRSNERLKRVKNSNIIDVWEKWNNNTKIMKQTNKNASHKLWWWRSTKSYNFGDEITPWLFEKMFGFHQDTAAKLTEPNILLAVGSIMRLANEKNEVWGSGIRNIDQSDFKKAKKFHAVRGLFTRARILEMGWECPEVYGDPGLLLPDYYNPILEKKHKLGVIPHIVDFEELNAHFKDMEGVKMINLESNDIEGISRDVLECDHIVSTSLHGVITAVAYGVPVRWYKCSDKITGDDIKFYDFFSSLDSEVFNKFDRVAFKAHDDKYNPLDFNPNDTIDDICANTYDISLGDFDKDKLINACPFTLDGSKVISAPIEKHIEDKFSVVMISYLKDYKDARSQPVYKFNRAVQSFVDQRYDNKELIIVSDGCPLTVKEYNSKWSKFDNIKLIETDKSVNQWPGSKRQVGVESATGKWITYLDTDDMLHHSHLTNLSFHVNDDLNAIFNKADTVGLNIKVTGSPNGWAFVNGRKIHGSRLEDYISKLGGSQLYSLKIMDKMYRFKSETNAGLKFSTAGIAHKKECGVEWSDRSARGEDVIFSDELLKKGDYKIINSPTYIVCHVPGRLDI